LLQTIKELKESSDTGVIESLRLSLKEFMKKSTKAVSERSKIESRLNALKEQGQRFVAVQDLSGQYQDRSSQQDYE